MKRLYITTCFFLIFSSLAGAEDAVSTATSTVESPASNPAETPPQADLPPSSDVSAGGAAMAEPTPVPQPPQVDTEDLPQEDSAEGVGSGGFNKSVLAVMLQPNGRVLVAGQFTSYGGIQVGRGIARLDSKASLDKGFTANTLLTFAKGEFYALALERDGKILAGGNFILHGKGTDAWKFFCRFYPDGRLDESFGNLLGEGFDNTVVALAVQSDGKILVGGNFSTYGNAKTGGLARMNTQGHLDTDFQSRIGAGIDAKGTVKSVVIQSDNKILIVGDFTSFNGRKVDGVVRLNPDGSLDEEFYKTAGNSFFVGFPLLEAEDMENEAGLYLSKAMVQSDGHIVLGGEFISYDKQQDIYSSRILRLDAAGNLDLDFIKAGLQHKFTSDVNAILQLKDGKILIGCSAPFSRLEPNGKHDTDFLLIAGRAFGGDINTLSLQPDGKVIVAGRFNAYKGIKVGNIVRLNPDGTMDERFVSGSYK